MPQPTRVNSAPRVTSAPAAQRGRIVVGASGGAALAMASAMPVAIPQPRRSPLRVLPGGLRHPRIRFDLPALALATCILVVVAIAAVVAVRIETTKLNGDIGTDLGSISRLQQSTTQARERLSRQVNGTSISTTATRRGLIQPDVSDVSYVKPAGFEATARKAAQALQQAPSAQALAAAAASNAVAASTASAAASTTAGAAATTTGTAAPTTTSTPAASVAPAAQTAAAVTPAATTGAAATGGASTGLPASN